MHEKVHALCVKADKFTVALEEAAKVVDDGAERESLEAQKCDASDPHGPFSMYAYKAAGWRDAAAAIRALLGKET